MIARHFLTVNQIVFQRLTSWIFCQDLSRILKTVGKHIQESYQDLAISWKIIQEIQDAKMQKVKIFHSRSMYSPHVPEQQTLRFCCISFDNSNSKLNKFQRGRCNCYWYSTEVKHVAAMIFNQLGIWIVNADAAHLQSKLIWNGNNVMFLLHLTHVSFEFRAFRCWI